MLLLEKETKILDVIARYNFLSECREQGDIAEETYKKKYKSFGLKNKLMIMYYLERLAEHRKEMLKFLKSSQREYK